MTFDDGPLAVDLIDPVSDLSPGEPSRPVNVAADARGLSIEASLPDFELPGILERMEPLNDRVEPCVSDLLNEGRFDSASGALKLVEEESLGVRDPSLPLEG